MAGTSRDSDMMERNEDIMKDVIEKCGDMVLCIRRDVLITEKINDHKKRFSKPLEKERNEENGKWMSRRRNLRREVNVLQDRDKFLLLLFGDNVSPNLNLRQWIGFNEYSLRAAYCL